MKNKNKNKRQKGYTLMEILIVVVIIGAMGYFSIPMYNKIINKADVSDALHNIDMFSGAQAKYFIENGKYTSNLSTLETPLKGEKAKIDTTRFTYTAGDPREDDYCIYSANKIKKYTLARNYRTNSEILCEGSDCGKIESFVSEGDFKELCSKNGGNPQSCNNTEESCRAMNKNWGLLGDCTCGCTVEEKICNKSQRWSVVDCACVQWNSCDLTEEKCHSLYTPNHFLHMDGSGSCECQCKYSEDICKENNADGFDEKRCSCICVNDDVKKCAEQGKVLTGDCQCVCAEVKQCAKGYVFSNEKCECIKTDCTTTEEECKKKNEKWTLLEDCSCGCDKSLLVKRCPTGYVYSKEKCACVTEKCDLTEEECKKESDVWVVRDDCTCGCEKVEPCGTDAIWNSMKCACEKKDCTKDDDYCKKYFGEDYYINKEKCECVKKECDKTDDYCKKYFGEDYYINKEKCECVKKECDKTDDYCKKYYGEDYYINTEKCECVKNECDKTEEECKKMNENYILDTGICNCKCGLVEKDCTSQGMTFNSSKCKCEEIGCGITAEQCKGVNPNWTLLGNCTCGCPKTVICKDGTTWNTEKCECQKPDCDKTEESCKKFNVNWTVLPDCTCGCPTVAHCTTPGEVWNAETCLCEKNSCNGLTDADCKAQNPNFYLEGTKCRCLCGVDKAICGLQGLWFDQENCLCKTTVI